MTVADSAAPGGFEAAALGALLLQPWRDLQRLPAFAWLAPQPAVRLLQADGASSLWIGERRRAAAAEREWRAAPFTAVELPAEQVLESRVTLPPTLAATDRDDALALQVRMASPFDPADLVWGARPGDAPGEWVALLASRRAVQARLDAVAADVGRGAAPEVWAFDGQGRPVVLRGFGEAARQRRSGRGRGLALALLLLALLLLLAAAVTPTLQLRFKAQQAEQAEAELQQRLAPVLAQREALAKAQARVEALRGLMAERVDLLSVLDLVTQAVPDDTWLQRLQLQGARVTISGQTPNTAALMNRLSSQPQVREVKAPAPATRAMGGRENFTIEFSLAPEALRPVAVAPAGAVAAPTAVPSAPAAAAAASAPAAAAASAPAAAASAPAAAPVPAPAAAASAAPPAASGARR
ncbi:MAG: PilN domain-containing protein [Proteobacteria bacterium]|nr:PilN domain-containing protein [Pseudomonadota bacterium]